MPKLYTVVIEHEIVVVAESIEDAEKHAQDAMDEDLSSSDAQISATEMRHLPADWDLNSIPFGDRSEGDPDRTIQGWLDKGAGEGYLKMCEKLQGTKT